MKLPHRLLAPALALGLLGATVTASQKPIATFDAQAINMDAPAGLVAGSVQIQVSRWSTEAEAEQLRTVLIEQGEQKLVDTVSKMSPVGSIRTPDSVGYTLRYARQSKVGTSDRIVIVTDRPISFWERRAGTTTVDYPFTVIELRVGPNGKGEGKISVATKIMANKATKEIQLENYTIAPVLLQNVQRS